MVERQSAEEKDDKKNKELNDQLNAQENSINNLGSKLKLFFLFSFSLCSIINKLIFFFLKKFILMK